MTDTPGSSNVRRPGGSDASATAGRVLHDATAAGSRLIDRAAKPENRKKTVATGIGVVALLLLLTRCAGSGAADALVISSFDGAVYSSNLSPGEEVVPAPIYGATRDIEMFDSDLGKVQTVQVAVRGNDVYAVNESNGVTSVERGVLGGEESETLFQAQDGISRAIIDTDGSLFVSEYSDGMACYKVEGSESALLLAQGDTCEFSSDLSRVVAVTSGEQSAEISLFSIDGQELSSFVVDAEATGGSLPVVNNDRMGNFSYLESVDEGQLVGHYLNESGDEVGVTPELANLTHEAAGDAIFLYGDVDGVASMFAGIGDTFGLVAEGAGGRMALSPDNSTVYAVVVDGERAEVVRGTPGAPFESVGKLGGVDVATMTISVTETYLVVGSYPGTALNVVNMSNGEIVQVSGLPSGSMETVYESARDGQLFVEFGGDSGSETHLVNVENSELREIASGPVRVLAEKDDYVLTTGQDGVNVVNTSEDTRPKKLFRSPAAGQVFLRDGTLFTSVTQEDGDLADLSSVVTNALDGQTREETLLYGYTLAYLAGAELLPRPEPVSATSPYTSVSKSKEEIVNAAIDAIGCSEASVLKGQAATLAAEECVVVAEPGVLDIQVGPADRSGTAVGSVTVFGVLPDATLRSAGSAASKYADPTCSYFCDPSKYIHMDSPLIVTPTGDEVAWVLRAVAPAALDIRAR